MALGYQPTAGLTNSPGPRGQMKQGLQHALRGLGDCPTPADIIAVVSGYPASETQPCLRAGCPKTCDWQPSRGRPRLYCSDACRRKVLREREALEEQLEQLVRCLALVDTARKRQLIESRMANIRWVLSRYPKMIDEDR